MIKRNLKSEKIRQKIKDVPKVHPLNSVKLLILALSGCFCLLLALYAGLLVALSLAKLGQNAGLNALSFKTTKSAVKSFIFFYSDFCHFLFSLPPLCKETKSQYFYLTII